MNGRNLEVRFRGPPGFDGLERAAREAAQARFQRGQINVTLQARRAEAAGAASGSTASSSNATGALPTSSSRPGAPRRRAPTACWRLRGVIEGGEEDETPEARAAVETAMAASRRRGARRPEGSRGWPRARRSAPVLAGLVDRIEALRRRGGDRGGRAAAGDPEGALRAAAGRAAGRGRARRPHRAGGRGDGRAGPTCARNSTGWPATSPPPAR